jgi:site-specific recombinase XerD
LSTEKTYIAWIKQFVLYHHKRHPLEMGALEVEAFLIYLATQNQALSATLFLYREVLAVDLPWLDNFERSKKPRRLPVVLTLQEIQACCMRHPGCLSRGLMIKLLYGTGMRLMEAVRCCG